MVVKARIGRFRYIVFRVVDAQPVSKGALIAELNRASRQMKFKTMPWLIIFENNRGLVRCSHTDKEKCIQLLVSLGRDVANATPTDARRTARAGILVETLGSSGTIKKARAKYLNIKIFAAQKFIK